MRQALEMALDAMKSFQNGTNGLYEGEFEEEIKTCEKALAQPEQEPVGQLLEEAYGRGQVMWFNKPKDESMLYTTPPQRKPLTDEQILELNFDGEFCLITDDDEAILDFARLVEAAHGIKEKTV